MDQVDVLVVGAGSAGLSVSHELGRHGIDHLVLERGRVGQTWRDRWESFCLVTPNWTVRLPGGTYDGDDPDGFMPRDDIVAHLERYAASSAMPVREGVAVARIDRSTDAGRGGSFVARTSAGDVRCSCVVVCTGAFQRPYRPAGAASLPASVLQIDLEQYRSPSDLPAGRVLIVGSGQSGCQLAEELLEAGHEVVLSCGKAPWGPRRTAGRDLVWWLLEAGFLDASVSSLPTPAARLTANPIATGHGGGHDLSLRILRARGVTLAGHFQGASDGEAHFAPDLAETVAWGDARYRDVIGMVHRAADAHGIAKPELPEPEPFDGEAPASVGLADVGTVLFTGGYRPDYRSWLPWADAFDDMGFPIQVDGASTVVDGLYFAGTHFLRKRKSSTLFGVGEDATLVADAVAARLNA